MVHNIRLLVTGADADKIPSRTLILVLDCLGRRCAFFERFSNYFTSHVTVFSVATRHLKDGSAAHGGSIVYLMHTEVKAHSLEEEVGKEWELDADEEKRRETQPVNKLVWKLVLHLLFCKSQIAHWTTCVLNRREVHQNNVTMKITSFPEHVTWGEDAQQARGLTQQRATDIYGSHKHKNPVRDGLEQVAQSGIASLVTVGLRWSTMVQSSMMTTTVGLQI